MASFVSSVAGCQRFAWLLSGVDAGVVALDLRGFRLAEVEELATGLTADLATSLIEVSRGCGLDTVVAVYGAMVISWRLNIVCCRW